MSTSSESQPPGPEQTKQDTTTPDKTSKSKMDTLLSKLPPSVVRNLKDTRKWKNWFRSMVVIFVCVIYLVVQNTLEVLGQAGFFSRKSRFEDGFECSIKANRAELVSTFCLSCLCSCFCLTTSDRGDHDAALNAIRYVLLRKLLQTITPSSFPLLASPEHHISLTNLLTSSPIPLRHPLSTSQHRPSSPSS